MNIPTVVAGRHTPLYTNFYFANSTPTFPCIFPFSYPTFIEPDLALLSSLGPAGVVGGMYVWAQLATWKWGSVSCWAGLPPGDRTINELFEEIKSLRYRSHHRVMILQCHQHSRVATPRCHLHWRVSLELFEVKQNFKVSPTVESWLPGVIYTTES